MSVYANDRRHLEDPWRICGECGCQYQITDRWRNHFLCSVGCCQARLHRNNPAPLVEDYEDPYEWERDYEDWRRSYCLP